MDKGHIAKEELRAIVNKIERLEDEKFQISETLKEVYQEAKSIGFDIKTLKKVIKLRKMDKAKLEEEDILTEMYRDILNI